MSAFSFGGFTAKVVSLSVETPKAELADFTSTQDPTGQTVIVPTGDWSGGSIVVEYISQNGSLPHSLVRQRSALTFSGTGFSLSINAICESASGEARVGELFRGSLRFVPTDAYG